MTRLSQDDSREPVSLIMTFYNERASVDRFFDDLPNWTRLPDEIVMVDGGSNDGTQAIVRERARRSPITIRFIEKDRCNISQGRNIAIENARHDIIAVTDMGCRIDTRWLERIVAGFENDESVDVVGGYYEPIHHTALQDCFYYLTQKDQLSPRTFIPSSRSVAFRRGAWEKAGRYPEDMITGEDTLFMLRMRRNGAKEVLAADAKVFWEARDSYSALYRQYFRYARGAGKGLVQPGLYLTYIVGYLFLLLLGLLAIIYGPVFAWFFLAHLALYSALRIFRKPLVLSHLSIANVVRCYGIVITIDLATVFGYVAGIYDRYFRRQVMFEPPTDRGEHYGQYWGPTDGGPSSKPKQGE